MRVLWITVILAVLLGACGGGDGDLSAEDQRLADAIAAQLTEDDDGPPVRQAEAQCFGDRTVDKIGADRLDELGLGLAAVQAGTSPSDVDLDDGDVETMLDAFMDCVDFGQLFTDGLLEDAGGAVSEGSARCIAEGIDDDFIRSAARGGITGDESSAEPDAEALSEIFGLMADCLSPEELQAVTGG